MKLPHALALVIFAVAGAALVAGILCLTQGRDAIGAVFLLGVFAALGALKRGFGAVS